MLLKKRFIQVTSSIPSGSRRNLISQPERAFVKVIILREPS
jgi:hypothetical protein